MINWKRLGHDLITVLILIVAVGAVLYYLDPANVAVFHAALIAIFVVGTTHLTRRLLFPSLDLQAIARDAYEDKNLPAAIIVLTVIVFLIAVMYLPFLILK